MLDALPVALTIDGYESFSDNAEGISEIAGLPSFIRHRTDAHDTTGNTTTELVNHLLLDQLVFRISFIWCFCVSCRRKSRFFLF